MTNKTSLPHRLQIDSKTFRACKYFLLFPLLISLPAKAEFSESINWLKNEPVSMLELGIIRLNQRMERLSDLKYCERVAQLPNISSEGGFASWEGDSIVLHSMFMGYGNIESCKKLMVTLKQGVSQTAWNSSKDFILAARNISKDFVHIGPQPRVPFRDFHKEVAEIITLKISIYGPQGSFTCESSFNSDETKAISK